MKQNEHLHCHQLSQLHKGLSSAKAPRICCCRRQCQNVVIGDCDLACMVVTVPMRFFFLPSLRDPEQKLCPNAWESLESGRNLLLIFILFLNEQPICNEQLEYQLFYLSNDFSSAAEKGRKYFLRYTSKFR